MNIYIAIPFSWCDENVCGYAYLYMRVYMSVSLREHEFRIMLDKYIAKHHFVIKKSA